MATSETTGSRGAILRRVADARGLAVMHRTSHRFAAMAALPREAQGDADDEWLAVLRAVHALRARDWPAVIVPVSGESLASPGLAARLDDLVARNDLRPGRLWIEVDSSGAVLSEPEVVAHLTQHHMIGVRLDVAQGFRERALVPELAELGIAFAWLAPTAGRCVADDLSSLIVGRSLVRRAQAHGMAVIAAAELEPDLAPPFAP